MEVDARGIPDGTVLDADLCIVGAGPAGLALAREFIGKKTTVLIVESGGARPDDALQQLNEGRVVGDPYAGLRRTRHRGVGGAANLWNTDLPGGRGAKYVPLDRDDFVARDGVARDAWPFDFPHLEPYYRRAQTVVGIGPFAYDATSWVDDAHPCLPLGGTRLSTAVYQFGLADLFTGSHPRAIAESDNVTVCAYATVCRLRTDGTGRKIVDAEARSVSGAHVRVRAAVFVLAAGAVENARLLLVSGDATSGGVGNRHGWVGRCFMEHPRDLALTLRPHSRDLFRHAAFYDVHPSRNGAVVMGRLALEERTTRDQDLPNASITLLPAARPPASPGGRAARLLAPLRRLAAGARGAAYASVPHGWSRMPDLAVAFDAFQLLVNLEQRPHPDNRVVLSRGRDRLGTARVELRWRWRPDDQAGVERLRAVLAAELEAAGLGRIDIHRGLRPDPNAHHHAGTTRMHVDARWGVADGDGRVHDTDNLYVAGASVFPTAGFANPTLTIVALALRLADHLQRRL